MLNAPKADTVAAMVHRQQGSARQRSPDAADMEAIELANGDQKAVVIRW